MSGLDSLNNSLLKSSTELGQLLVVIEFSSVSKSSRPSENGSDWVGGGSLSLLPLSIMPGDSSVSGLGLESTILVNEHGGHETKGSETLSDNV